MYKIFLESFLSVQLSSFLYLIHYIAQKKVLKETIWSISLNKVIGGYAYKRIY